MNLLEIHIRHFRNLEALDWEPSQGINVIVGENGQGKTNLLEAIYFGLLGRSFRTRREEQCLPWEGADVAPADAGTGTSSGGTTIRTTLKGIHSTREIRVALGRGFKRAWSDGVLVPRLGDLWSGSGVVVFSPADVDLFRNAPAGRRAFMDQLFSLGSRAYLGHLQRYQRALKQINAALKPHSGASSTAAATEPFYRVLAESGEGLMELRERYLRELEALCAASFRSLEGLGVFALKYDPNFRGGDGGGSGQPLSEGLHARWQQRHEESRRLGALESGPQRDDLRVTLDGRDLGKFGSQGQHRLVALALKLSAADWLADGLKDTPLLLLDDFGSELDRRRCDAVIAHLRGRMQTFITATGVEALGGPAEFDQVRELRSGRWA